MDIPKFLEKLAVNDSPVGLGGCKSHENGFPCCEYNITIFDNTHNLDSIEEFEGQTARIHHGSLDETKSELFVQYDQMKIIQDDKWDLRMLLSKIKEKRENFFLDAAKGSLVDSIFCAVKSKDALKNSDPFASTWQKCAAYYISDAISILNKIRPSPAHMLKNLRDLKKNTINESLSILTDSIGIERATQSLLSRMVKSTMGFSDMIEKNNHSKIIQEKHDYLVQHSLLSDCYFYLGYINKQNIRSIKNTLSRRPDLIHVLKVAMDLENNPEKTLGQAETLQETANLLLEKINT